MGGVSEDVLLARAYLSRVAEPASVPLWNAVRRDGPVRTVLAIREGHPDADVRAAVTARRAETDPEADLEAAARHRCRLVVPESDDWPHFAMSALEATGRRRFAEFDAGKRRPEEAGVRVPPLALWVRGDLGLAPIGVRAVGIVGARAMSSYGEHVTKVLSYGLAARDLVIVSGGAFGVDGCAHRAALAADGTTVLVSAAGLDRSYPAAHARLFDEVAQTGLVVSESPPGVAPHRHRFLSRNRLIAALSAGVLVTEAAARSGALNTAAHARALGRPVMAVPGPVTSTMSAGCHTLLRQVSDVPGIGATLVTGLDDVLDVIGGTANGATPDGDDGPQPMGTTDSDNPTHGSEVVRQRLDRLPPTARQVFDGFTRRGVCEVDELVLRTGIDIEGVMTALPALELSGLVEASGSGFRITSAVVTATGRKSRSIHAKQSL